MLSPIYVLRSLLSSFRFACGIYIFWPEIPVLRSLTWNSDLYIYLYILASSDHLDAGFFTCAIAYITYFSGLYSLSSGLDSCIFGYLYSGLGEANLDGELLPGEDVWVVGPGEGFLQLLQLEGGEGGPVAPLLPHLRTSCLLYVLHIL